MTKTLYICGFVTILASMTQAQVITITGELAPPTNGDPTSSFADANFTLVLQLADPPPALGGGSFLGESATLTINDPTDSGNTGGPFLSETTANGFTNSIEINASGDLLGRTSQNAFTVVSFVGTSLDLNPFQSPLFSTFDPSNDDFAVNSNVTSLFADDALGNASLNATNVAITSVIPEPGSFGILGLAGLGLMAIRRKSRAKLLRMS